MVSNASPGDRARLSAVLPMQEFRDAMEDGQVVVHYQPQVELATGVLVGAEALLRWEHPEGGLLAPDDFLSAVVHTQLMPAVTRFVADSACARAVRWGGIDVAVNVSGRDIGSPAFPTMVADVLDRHGLDGSRLVVEVTEQELLHDIDNAVRRLEAVRELGVEVSLDDFGTGYSSLLYLRRLPVTEIKIDRSFIAGVGENRDDDAIVTALIRLAHGVGVRVVAEGVETRQQAEALAARGCHRAQGYLFGRPQPELVFTPYPVTARPRRIRRRSAPVPAAARETIDRMAAEGASLHTIAAALNRTGVRTASGTLWRGATVAKALSAADR